MAKTRLNDYTRRKLIDAIVDYTIAERMKNLRQEEVNLANEVINSALTEDQLMLLSQIPGNWLPEIECVEVQCAAYSITLNLVRYNWVSGRRVLEVGKPRRLPQWFENRIDAHLVPEELSIRVQKHAFAKESVSEQSKNLARELSALFGTMRYHEDVSTAFPNIEEMAPGVLEGPSVALVTSAEKVLCAIAGLRGEEREGCCDGKRIEDIKTPAVITL